MFRKFSDLAKIRDEHIELARAEDNTRKEQALIKAYEQICRNGSMRFENGVLTFKSLSSGKQRYITCFGCHSSCDCCGLTSYHSAAWELLAAYTTGPLSDSQYSEYENYVAEVNEHYNKEFPAIGDTKRFGASEKMWSGSAWMRI